MLPEAQRVRGTARVDAANHLGPPGQGLIGHGGIKTRASASTVHQGRDLTSARVKIKYEYVDPGSIKDPGMLE